MTRTVATYKLIFGVIKQIYHDREGTGRGNNDIERRKVTSTQPSLLTKLLQHYFQRQKLYQYRKFRQGPSD